MASLVSTGFYYLGDPWLPRLIRDLDDKTIKDVHQSRSLIVYVTGDHAPRRDAAGEACLLRSGGTTAVGAVVINIDRLPTEIAVGNVEAMLMHELLHTLGLVRPHFAGSNAMAAARECGIIDAGATSLPTTNDGHWDGVLFAGELMTGMSVRGLLSRVTVMALRDLGYVVEPGASDLFGPGLWRS